MPPDSSRGQYQRLVDLSARCQRNAQRLRAMTRSSTPPAGLDELLAQMRRDIAEARPLVAQFESELNAAAKIQQLKETQFGRHPVLIEIQVAEAMLQTIDDAGSRKKRQE